MRQVHAVIVAYGDPDDLARCLSGLDGQVPVTVIDNSSAPDVEATASAHGAAYVDPGENRGFAAGVNIALERLVGTGVDVLLLNPDALVTPGAVRELTDFMDAAGNERVAAVAPRLQGPDGSAQRVSWPFPTPARMWAEAIGMGRLPARRTFAVGAVLLLRREALAEVGGFDERFFLYGEEADWQRRAWQRGWRSAVCSTAIASHQGAGTSADSRRRELLFHAGQETYIRKWYGASGWEFYRVAACAGAAARALILLHDRRSQAARRALLYLRGPRQVAARHD
jgi:GT2 family glycosyltransferase